MKYNTTQVIPRHNRPSVQQNTLLELYITNNGSYYNPFAVSSVMVFKDSTASSVELSYITNGLPEPLLDLEPSSSRYGLVKESIQDQAVFRFAWKELGLSATESLPGKNDFPYGPGNGASGIYKSGEGRFACVLDPNASSIKASAFDSSLSNGPNPYDGITEADILANGCSAAGTYYDVWTVKNLETGAWETHCNKFQLVQDRVVTSTEALAITNSTQLKNKYVELGSITNLTFLNNFTIENRNIERYKRDSFRESILTDAQIKITKINESPSVSNRYTVHAFTVDDGDIRITSDDTVLYRWNTINLITQSSANFLMGGPTGVYECQLQLTYLDNVVLTPRFKLVVR
jgi:hypothetical protein